MCSSITHRFQKADQLRLNLTGCHDVDIKRGPAVTLRRQPERADHCEAPINFSKETAHKHENTSKIHWNPMLHGNGFGKPFLETGSTLAIDFRRFCGLF